MWKSLAFIAFGLLSLFSTSSSSVADCGQGKSVFTIVDQNFSPEPPVADQPYDYWFYYSIPEGVEVTGGTAKYSLSLNGIPFTPSVEDLCTQTSCPKAAGYHNETSTDTWPSGISGKVISKLEWFDTNGNLLLCSQTTERV